MSSLNQSVKNLFRSQIANWELASKNFADLQFVTSRTFSFANFEVKVQFNPARMVSSVAKTDAQSIAARKCFLCAENRPQVQEGVEFNNFIVLVNPFPIFPEHFTIPLKAHLPQQILPYFTHMLELASNMTDYLLFYNGPRCGASAPDHMHFQAGTKNFLPLVNDYFKLAISEKTCVQSLKNAQVYESKQFKRTFYCIESTDHQDAFEAFKHLYARFVDAGNPELEPMMNLVCLHNHGKCYTFVLPRKAFRPWQYAAEAENQLLISPATVEMFGVFITPVESHFNRISASDIESIFEQTSF